LLTKLKEFQKLEVHGHSDFVEYQGFKHNIGNNPLNDAHSTLAENIQHIQSSPQGERNSDRQERISKWKIRLCQQCYHWLKRPSVQYFRGLISQSLNVDVATADFLQSLSLIRDHWGLVWRRDPVNADAALRRILRRMKT